MALAANSKSTSFVGEFDLSGNLCMRAEPSPVPFSVGEVTPADLWVDEDTARSAAHRPKDVSNSS